MTAPLRAFLMLRSDELWDTTVFHNLEELVRAWEQRKDNAATAVIHVGFSRSPARLFDEAASKFPGQVLLTVGAKYTLPKGYTSTTQPVARCEAGELYLATQGWGYDASTYQPPPETASEPLRMGDWLSAFTLVKPETTSVLLTAGIVDDKTYLEREFCLPSELRREAGLYRCRTLNRLPDDPCEIAKTAPPWLRERSFGAMPLTVRLKNAFANLGIDTVSDLDRYTTSVLLATPNVGRTSVGNLASILLSALSAGPLAQGFEAAQDLGLLAAIRRSLLNCGPRARDVLGRRMGLDGLPETLNEIGTSYKVTRERIRQIEAKALRRLLAVELWDDLLTKKLKEQLTHREYPLPLRGVEAVEPWFAGVAERPHIVRYLLAAVPESGAYLVEIDGIEYLALTDQEHWDATLRNAKSLLSGGVGKTWSESKCRQLVGGLLSERSREFESLLWAKVSQRCHFVECEGTKILHQYGRGAEQVVETILEESDRPLHFTEIAEKASARAGRSIDVRRAHNAAASVGLLFGRGTYGTSKHLPVDASTMENLVDWTEDLIADSPVDRQWHCSELVAALAERLEDPPALNKYILDIALRNSGHLRRHKRMVWSQCGGDEEAGRIDIRQAILATLQVASQPLRASDIYQRLIAVRGLGQTFQIVQADPLIRVGPAIWGLNDRDVEIKREDQPRLVESLIEVLERRGQGLHISELRDAVSFPDSMLPEAVLSIATLDERLRSNVGQYLFMKYWKTSRRETIQDAVRNVLLERADFVSFETIVEAVEQKVGRKCKRGAVSGSLQAVEAEFDGAGRWRLATTSDVEDDDDAVDLIPLDADEAGPLPITVEAEVDTLSQCSHK